MSIQELIQKNKDLEKLNVIVSNLYLSQRQKIIDWHIQSLKDLIDAVIEEEEKEIKMTRQEYVKQFGELAINPPKTILELQYEAYNQAKNDTISRLKDIKEML
jgi:hypothetical protein